MYTVVFLATIELCMVWKTCLVETYDFGGMDLTEHAIFAKQQWRHYIHYTHTHKKKRWALKYLFISTTLSWVLSLNSHSNLPVCVGVSLVWALTCSVLSPCLIPLLAVMSQTLRPFTLWEVLVLSLWVKLLLGWQFNLYCWLCTAAYRKKNKLAVEV